MLPLNRTGTASGNVDCGIYTADGTRLVSAGSTAQSGTQTLQVVALGTPLLLEPNTYYIARAQSSTVGTADGLPMLLYGPPMAGAAQMASAFPLPATFTFASESSWTTSLGLPLFGISNKVSTLV